MSNEVLNALAKRIIENGQSRKEFSFHFHSLEEDLKIFLNSSVSESNKALVLEKLYLLQLYSDAYVSADSRIKEKLMSNIKTMFQETKNDNDCGTFVNELNNTIDLLEKSEVNPIETTKKMLADKEKYKGTTF